MRLKTAKAYAFSCSALLLQATRRQGQHLKAAAQDSSSPVQHTGVR